MTTATKQAGATIALSAAKRRHGRAAYESLGLYLQAWIEETAARATAGVQLEEGRRIYRKLGDLLKEQGII